LPEKKKEDYILQKGKRGDPALREEKKKKKKKSLSTREGKKEERRFSHKGTPQGGENFPSGRRKDALKNGCACLGDILMFLNRESSWKRREFTKKKGGGGHDVGWGEGPVPGGDCPAGVGDRKSEGKKSYPRGKGRTDMGEKHFWGEPTNGGGICGRKDF